MEKLTIIIFTLIAVGGLLGIAYIAIYNRLQKYTIRIKEAESEIDETLRKRYDLLVSMETLINSNTDLNQRNFEGFETDKMSNFDVDRKLSKIKEIFKMIGADYPDKLDNENFRNLMIEIKIIEEKSDAAKAFNRLFFKLVRSKKKTLRSIVFFAEFFYNLKSSISLSFIFLLSMHLFHS